MRGTQRSSRTLDKKNRAGVNEEGGKGQVLISYFLCVKRRKLRFRESK